MITEILVTLVVNFIEWFVSLVPDFGLSLNELDFGDTWSSLGAGAAALNGWLPVLVVASSAGIFLGVQVVMSVWGFIVWVYHQFWGSD